VKKYRNLKFLSFKLQRIFKMVKCIYCKCQIEDERAVDVCDKCGVGVWGEKMFQAIRQSMGEAKVKGDLHQGLINVDCGKDQRIKG
jgi:uncharacterized UBP type Zn finger protein